MSVDMNDQVAPSDAGSAADAAPAAGGNQPVQIWLYAIAALIALMVVVGGATRLTDSGLSITEWQVVMGAIPPLTEAHWLTAFDKYKQIPEYTNINRGMSLEEFKFIYWWEWGHRFLGRIVGFVFLIPLLILLVHRAYWARAWRQARRPVCARRCPGVSWLVHGAERVGGARRCQPVPACRSSGASCLVVRGVPVDRF